MRATLHACDVKLNRCNRTTALALTLLRRLGFTADLADVYTPGYRRGATLYVRIRVNSRVYTVVLSMEAR